MERRVLVLRPEPGAGATASRLADLGFEPVLLPLTRIVAAAVDPPAGIERVSAVAATSANALRHAHPSLISKLRARPLFAVGTATAAAARAAGFDVAHVGGADGLELARHVADRLPAGASVAYMCGKVRRSEFEQELATRGLSVLPLPTYDTLQIEYSDAELSARLGSGQLWAVLIHSPLAGEALAALAVRPVVSPLLGAARIAALSGAAAAAIADAGSPNVQIAGAPSEAALLELLCSWT